LLCAAACHMFSLVHCVCVISQHETEPRVCFTCCFNDCKRRLSIS